MKNTFESAFASRLDGAADRPVAVVAPLRRSTNPGPGTPSDGRSTAAAAASVSLAPSVGGSPAQLCGQGSTTSSHQAPPHCVVSLQTVVRADNPGRRDAEDRSGNRSKASKTSASNDDDRHNSEKCDDLGGPLPRRSSSSSDSLSVGLPSSSLGPPSPPSSQSPPRGLCGGGGEGDYTDAVFASNFYYGTLTNADAKSRLHRTPVGTFLLRDSSDRRFVYSLSVKTARGTTSIRISGAPPSSTSGGRCCFRLDSDPNQKSQMPAFGSVLELVEHYHLGALARDGGGGAASKQRRSHCVLLESSGRSDTPMVLRRPLELSPAPLAHLCRRLVNRLVAGETKRLALVERMAHATDETKHQLKRYLVKYPFRV